MEAAPVIATAPRSVWVEALLMRPTRWAALASIGLSFVLPFEGFGVDVCALHRTTGLPCPGCGLTRAFISVSRGDFDVALGLNPFVTVLYPLFVALAVLAVAPAGMRQRLERWVASRSEAVGVFIRVGLVSFLGFGAIRLAWFLLQGERFP